MRLPEWCVYVETFGLEWFHKPLLGFWAHLSWDIGEKCILNFLLNTTDGFNSASIHIGPWSLAESLEGIIKKIQQDDSQGIDEGSTARIAANYAPLLSLILYLCSTEPEISSKISGIKPHYPTAKKVKGGMRLFPPAGVRLWQTGFVTGERLEQERNSAERSKKDHKGPIPHLRRAHWHGYWSGSMKLDEQGEVPERRFEYKWLSPIFVGGAGSE